MSYTKRQMERNHAQHLVLPSESEARAMSDNATLVERLRARTQLHYSGQPEIGYDHVIHDPLCMEAADRIAELEADYAKAEELTRRAHAVAKKAMDRIAELEAERQLSEQKART